MSEFGAPFRAEPVRHSAEDHRGPQCPLALVVGRLDVAARQEHQQLVARRHGNGRPQVAALDTGRHTGHTALAVIRDALTAPAPKRTAPCGVAIRKYVLMQDGLMQGLTLKQAIEKLRGPVNTGAFGIALLNTVCAARASSGSSEEVGMITLLTVILCSHGRVCTAVADALRN